MRACACNNIRPRPILGRFLHLARDLYGYLASYNNRPPKSKSNLYIRQRWSIITILSEALISICTTKSLVRLNFFFVRLTVLQDTMLSIKLSVQRQKILEKLIFEIINRHTSMPKEPAEGTHYGLQL
jgi:hypothetical protein